MYIQISYPIIDIRPFVETDTHQIKAPNWRQKENVGNEFVRHFGHIRIANQYVDYLNKIPYSHSKGALKLPKFNDYNFLNDSKDKGPIQSPYPYRRLFVKTRRTNNRPFSCEARFDFGIKIKPSGSDLFDVPDLIDSNASINKVIKKFLEFPVSVGAVKGKKRNLDLPLGQIGSSIANLYLYSSSGIGNRNQVKKYWVNALQPTILLQIYHQHDLPITLLDQIDTGKIIQEYSNEQFRLLQFQYKAFGTTMPVWLMVRSDPDPLARMQEQQIAWNIIRLHSEYQMVINLSELVIDDRLTFTPRSDASQRFQYFITEVFDQISPKGNKAGDQNAIFQELAQNQYELISPEDCLKLMQKLSHIRKNVLRKLGNFNLTKNPNEGTAIEQILDQNPSNKLIGMKKEYIDKATSFVNQKNIDLFEAHIRSLISQGELEECLEILRAFLTLSDIKGRPLDTVTLQLLRFNTEKRAADQGIITRESYMVTSLQISQAILNSLQDIR